MKGGIREANDLIPGTRWEMLLRNSSGLIAVN
jgi:hypothetical protein